MTINQRYFLGLDGGGTSCRARLTDESGTILGEGRGGSCNVTIGAERAYAAIRAACDGAMAGAGPLIANAQIHACFGLAGTEATSHLEAISAMPFGFARLTIVNDSVIACEGAHAGDGAILIVGTGSQGLLMKNGAMTRAGGWGFALSDDASGAVMGRHAARLAVLAHDHIISPSPFTDALLGRFGGPSPMMEWALTALPRDWASLSPLVQEHARANDANALKVQAQSVAELAMLLEALRHAGAERIALVGGLAGYYGPLVPAHLKPFMVMPAGDAIDGALKIARRHAG